MSPETTCAFTGHRPGRLPWGNDRSHPRCRAVQRRLAQAIGRAYDRGCRHFLCGMARGGDLLFCQALLDFRRDHPDLTLEAALPYPDQTRGWPEEDRRRYGLLLAQCDRQTLVQPFYTPDAPLRRNRYMVDRAGRLIALYDGIPTGGTMATVAYALERARTLELIDPTQ